MKQCPRERQKDIDRETRADQLQSRRVSCHAINDASIRWQQVEMPNIWPSSWSTSRCSLFEFLSFSEARESAWNKGYSAWEIHRQARVSHSIWLSESLLKSKVKNHFIANTNSVHRGHINKEVLGFVKGKPKETNPAVMGNPINM